MKTEADPDGVTSCKPRNGEGCWRHWKLGERDGPEPVIVHEVLAPWFWTCGPQNCERMNFCCLKPPTSRCFVMAALRCSDKGHRSDSLCARTIYALSLVPGLAQSGDSRNSYLPAGDSRPSGRWSFKMPTPVRCPLRQVTSPLCSPAFCRITKLMITIASTY